MSLPTRTPKSVSGAASVQGLRQAVSDLASSAQRSVSSVRAAFVAGSPPLQTVGSGSAADYISKFGQGTGSILIRSTSRLGVSTSRAGSVSVPVRPELDYIEIGSDPAVGMLDSFFARVVVSLAKEEISRTKYVRILRCFNGRVDAPSPSFSALIDGMPLTQTRKSKDPVAVPAFRASEIGIGNKLTKFVADGQFSAQRFVVASGTMRPAISSLNTNRIGISTPAALVSIGNVDRSVLENITFFTNVRSTSPRSAISLPLSVGDRQGVNVLQGTSISAASAGIVEVGNSANFREIARVSTAVARQVGGFYEVDYVDSGVVYGASYSYYAVSVDSLGLESPRSRLVHAAMTMQRPPTTPSVLYSVVAGRPRFSIMCSGSFIDHVEIFRNGGNFQRDVQLLGSDGGLVVSTRDPASTDSGFFHITDVGVGSDRSNTFTDAGVSPGQNLKYRIYTVDSFGMKSQTPFSCSISIPDHGKRFPLGLPVITVEQDLGERNVKVSVSCDDPRVSAFIIDRKEIGVSPVYSIPTQPSYFTRGYTTAKRAASRNGPALPEESKRGWAGTIQPSNGFASMVDSAVGFDRMYQYAVRSVDLKGNVGPRTFSQPVRVSLKNIADPVVALSATLRTDGSGFPIGINLTWSGGTSDFSPTDMVGNQSVLADSSVRSVYQVERRLIGSPTWDAMPATTASEFFDPISSDDSPAYRPPYASMAAEYDYRVIAMQSGGFLGTYTHPVRAITSPNVFPPDEIWVRTTPTSLRPIGIVISWNYDGQLIDGWEIERASANKIFGAKIFSMDLHEARDLSYHGIAEVKRESSRASSVSSDGRSFFDKKVFVGNRFFVDQDISLDNSYYYRVRAVSSSGRASEWVYSGIMLSDSPHDRKLFSSLSDDEKTSLALDPRAIVSSRGS